MKTDIYQRIVADFGAEATVALRLLDQLDASTKSLMNDRVVRAIIFLSRGSLAALKGNIERARTDCRDILWQAEYDGKERRVRNFEKSFHELGLS
jgi:hypothetical protein